MRSSYKTLLVDEPTESGTKASISIWAVRIRTWFIWILLFGIAIDYGYHQYSTGWNDGYSEGYRQGEAQEPKVWQTLLK